MRTRPAARLAVLTLALAGCEIGNPLIVLGPDGGIRADDLPVVDVPDFDGGTDVGGEVGVDIGLPEDVPGKPDVPEQDAGPMDAGPMDAGPPDTGPLDTGPLDTGPRDTGVIDAGPPDTGPLDTGPRDTGPMDTGPRDTGPPDTGPVDTGVDVPVIVDTGPPDSGPTTITSYLEACVTTGTAAIDGFGRYVITGSTAGRTDDHQPTCTERATPDIGYLVNITAFSRVTWLARPTGTVFAPVVTLTQTCGEQDSKFTNEVACANNRGAAGAARGGVVDLPPGVYYLSVDGEREATSTESGPFELTVTVAPSERAPNYSVEPLTGTTCPTVPASNVNIENADDAVSGIQGLGFGFTFFGRSFTSLAFYTNGFFSFIVDEPNPWPAGTSWRNHSIVFDGQPRGVVAPFWDDLRVDNATGSGVYFWVDGAAPGRVAHVYWRNVNFYRDGATRISVEARLYQTTNVIEFRYCGENRNNAYSRGGSATIGVESYDQSLGNLIALNQVNIIAPGAGYRLIPR
ncbi:MAG: hypothetical protein Q8S73_16910 [Deltaproteobacteria bacterium]|nr:hypothetical protein [Myxococcales bacterium]MDP3215790.1 hypothetical protein [Deltaproteobacteria bacterium]